MLFHEIYGSYYHAVARILALAVKGELDEEKMLSVVQRSAFGESALTILPALKQEKWQLLSGWGTPIKHIPRRPVTTLELRWLKAISLDARIRLFDVDFTVFETLENVNWKELPPLFTPEDYVIFDRYNDGDPYEEEKYIQVFRTVLRAIHTGQRICVEYNGGKGGRRLDGCLPYHLEYSEKDDKFRVYAKANGRRYVMNLARIERCELVEAPQTGKRKREPVRYVGRGRRHKSYLVLELTEERNSLERVMLHFAHFEKEAEQLGENRYRIRIVYDKEDETELVIRVLSFGPLVKVTEPESFVSLIKERLYQQKSCGLR